MALRTFVKLNSITNLTDARYGSGMYVDLLGFDLNSDSENFIRPELFAEITGWVSGVDFVGEFHHHDSTDIPSVLEAYPSITWIELDRIGELQKLVGLGYSLIYKVTLEEVRHMEQEVAKVLRESGIILHVFSHASALDKEDLEAVAKLAQNCKVLLGAGVNKSNVLDLVGETGIYGITLSGGVEIKPGLKDMNELTDILETLETED
ncbi:phosphoribosylanthranilate isomerase [Algoriphagus aestuariicola]|uniref:phosphoribosylanthranilate isomerase n=1 Tax=Algoriphagus aestuariicola TaxID=1852016 RepID=A0ABS3BPN8_9BACT|nr:phosphoribosylanthranilate isomerase [Algoriphagus aestuariicola]MBN7800866.1 phosphoribosylanthranilate isomerase [Algoriphagus aestuariicola]